MAIAASKLLLSLVNLAFWKMRRAAEHTQRSSHTPPFMPCMMAEEVAESTPTNPKEQGEQGEKGGLYSHLRAHCSHQRKSQTSICSVPPPHLFFKQLSF